MPSSARLEAVDGPQVVIGLAHVEAPSSEELVSQAPEVREAPVASVTKIEEPTLVSAKKLEVVAEPVLALAKETLEVVAEKERLELTSESLERLELVQDKSLALEVEAHGEHETPPPVAKAAQIDSDRPAALDSGPKIEPDEISIPPIGDLHADKFFSEGEVASQRDLEAEEAEAWDAPKSRRKAAPEVVERRNRFAKYVKLAVAGAAVVCLAALGRTLVTEPKHAGAASKPTAAAIAPPAEPVATAPTAMAATTTTATAGPGHVNLPTMSIEEAAQGKPAEAKPEAAKAPEAEPAKAAEGAKPDDAKPTAEAKQPDPKAAAEEKVTARRSLERGKLDDAIAAGERSVALDPTDGEAWLILGASYQEKGNRTEARRAYKACSDQGKRGPIHECRAMLRF